MRLVNCQVLCSKTVALLIVPGACAQQTVCNMTQPRRLSLSIACCSRSCYGPINKTSDELTIEPLPVLRPEKLPARLEGD